MLNILYKVFNKLYIKFIQTFKLFVKYRKNDFIEFYKFCII